jgi:arylsulfatase A-like enzyme
MALNIDLAPTILAMAGVAAPKEMQGQDLQPVLRSAKAKGRADWYYEHTYNTDPPRKPIPKSEGVRTERWKYIRYTEQQPPLEQLFDLQADPGEERNLISNPSHHKTLTQLRERCDRYRDGLR